MNVFFSPFIVPIGAFVFCIVAIISGVIGQAHSRRIKAEQRMAMLARGMSIEQIERLLGTKEEEGKPAPKDPLRSLGNARRAGIILVSSGVGLIIFFVALTVIIGPREILSGAAVGLIPVAVGIGFFIDYHLQKRELARFGLEVESSVRE
jgi:Flp pilus assembly protein TadB